METVNEISVVTPRRRPWNKGKLIGPKPPLQPKHVWAIRTRLQLARRTRDLALFNLAIDSKLRGVRPGEREGPERRTTRLCYRPRDRPAEQDRSPGQVRDRRADAPGDRRAPCGDPEASRRFPVPGRGGKDKGLSTRQYARLLSDWLASIGLDPCLFGTHSLRRTKATLIYRRTGNLWAVQLLLGHTKVESTVRYLGIEIDDALAIAEQIDV